LYFHALLLKVPESNDSEQPTQGPRCKTDMAVIRTVYVGGNAEIRSVVAQELTSGKKYLPQPKLA
jgi:hypothetical protein